MAKIYIDNKPYEVALGQNLLQACLSLGFNLPYFCWHPAMHSVGACRQCAVKSFADEDDAAGRIVMACMTPVADGQRISIDDAEAAEFRTSVIEWLMVNHPHDCPVCDEGGECHLQDMTVMTGHNYRRHRFDKRTYRNQDLGPFVTHEMNRCIQCYRCVRFYRDFAGGRDLDVLGWHDRVYFGRSADGRLESEFSGNLVEVCPTGVFTDKTLQKHYTRKWDLATAPSVCVHCSLGCNTIPGERYGSLRRVHNRFNSQVNGYFLCDRGRYGYEFVNSERRLRSVMRRGAGGAMEAIAAGEAVRRFAELLGTPISRLASKEEPIRRSAFPGQTPRAVGLGSPRASLEANYALRRLVGGERFFTAQTATEWQLAAEGVDVLRGGPARVASLREIESADAVLILGEDLTNTAPMADFAVRQALRQKALKLADHLKVERWNMYAVQDVMQRDYSPVFVATPDETKLDAVSAGTFRAGPDDVAAFGEAVARAIEDQVRSGPVRASMDQPTAPQEGVTAPLQAVGVAAALMAADRPVVISGTGCGSAAVMQSAGAVVAALCKAGKPAGIFLAMRHCNDCGLAMLEPAGAAEDALAAGKRLAADTLVVLEADLFQNLPSALARQLIESFKNIVVMDHTATETGRLASLLLPCGTFADSDGTLVNNEGRAQRFYQIMAPAGDVRDSWRWIRDALVAAELLGESQWTNIDDLQAEMAAELPFRGVTEVAPPASFRMVGQSMPREPHRYSGRTAMTADESVHEPMPPADAEAPLSFSMEGAENQPPSPLLGRYWAPGWNSVSALNKFQQEVGGPLKFSNPGKRLIEARRANPGNANLPIGDLGNANREIGVPKAAVVGSFIAVPAWHIFGSEEMSALSPSIASLAPAPYVGIREANADGLGVAEGQSVTLTLQDGQAVQLPMRIRPGLASGVLALPVLAGQQKFDLPQRVALSVIPGSASEIRSAKSDSAKRGGLHE